MSTPANPNPKTFLITGTSSGFGKQLATVALNRGDNVVATARKLDDIRHFADEFPETAQVSVLDVTNPDTIASTVDAALSRFGQIDVLVNNAGYALFGAVEEMGADGFRKQFETNVFGLVAVTKAVLPHMRKAQAGHIIQLSSVGGQISPPGVGAYTASKHAVEGLSTALRAEVAAFGIRVTLVEPGIFLTKFDSATTRDGEHIAAYDELLEGVQRDTFGAYDLAANPTAGDPYRAAEAMYAIAGQEDAPFRLPLGRDAVEWLRQAYRERTDELELYAALAEATASNSSVDIGSVANDVSRERVLETEMEEALL